MSELFSSKKTVNGQPYSDGNVQQNATAVICPECQHTIRPGELICPHCGKYLADSSRPGLLDTNVLTDLSAATFPCPTCQHLCNPGHTVCPKCGQLFVEDADTNELNQKIVPEQFIHGPTNEISVDDEQPIILEIDGKSIALPIAAGVVLGRTPLPIHPDDKRPHVDLTAFNAHNKGVSREHAVIVRKHDLVYVIDLGSSNGTILNGTLLVPYVDRVLRSGDELRLGGLVMSVIFPSRMSINKRAHDAAS